MRGIKRLPVAPAAKFRTIIGRTLQFARRSRFPDQRAFAARVGISQPTLSRIESGTGNLSVVQLRNLAEALGLSASEILKRAERTETELARQGVTVVRDDKPEGRALAFLGGAALDALLAGKE